MSGWKLPGYVVEDLLGFGGSGEVWRARVISSGESVALKRIAIDDAAQVRAAQAEAALLATLDHPHLVRLHELVPCSDAIVLVLDLAAGGTLAELIAVRGRITPGEAITALAPVGAALAYAHAAGVVHGDVTPANVLFTDAGMPLLADLGVARLLGEHAPVLSTPAFIDPAVAAGCIPGPQSDVFMLAAVTLHALTGQPLWRGETLSEVLAAAAQGETGDICAVLDTVDVPDAMRAVVSRALAVEPSLRGSAAEFALDLRHAGTPLAVELSAGRRRVGPALPTVAGPESALEAPATAGADRHLDPARPAFDRPTRAAATVATAVLTHAVRARPRPLPARRVRRSPMGRTPTWLAWLAVGVLAIAAAVALGWTALTRTGSHQAAAVTASGVAGARDPAGGSAPPPTLNPSSAPSRPHPRPPASPASPAAPAASPPSAAASAAALDARAVSTVLATLDARRQQAFAERDSTLLGTVYPPGPLLSQDTAMLERLVPSGCRLLGVQTNYDDVRVTARSGNRVHAAVRATLSGSLLACSRGANAQTPGFGPVALQIVLVRHGAGYLIAGIER